MILNPELRRNLLLECNTHRFILVGGVLAGVFTLVCLYDARGSGNLVANVGLVIFVLTTMAWGSHRAGESLLDDLRERTWDAQRMSALSPWSMTWGKLAGATVIPWFAGSISLCVYFFGRQGPTVFERLEVIATCIAAGILVQSLSLIGALVGTRLDKHGKSTLTSWATVGILALVYAYFSIYYKSTDEIQWYGTTYNRNKFLTASVFALAVWNTLGAYRLMCMELAIATRPWAWISFVFYLTIYFTGSYIPPDCPLTRAIGLAAAMGLVVSIGATYLSAFALYRDPLTFRRLKTYVENSSQRRFFEDMPAWMASLTVAALCMLVCVAMHFAPEYSSLRIENVRLGAIAIWLYAIRDLAVLFYFTYSGTSKRVESSTIILLALLYWALPSILESTGLQNLSWLIRPPIWDQPMLSIGIIGVQVIIFSAICLQRYRQHISPMRFS